VQAAPRQSAGSTQAKCDHEQAKKQSAKKNSKVNTLVNNTNEIGLRHVEQLSKHTFNKILKTILLNTFLRCGKKK